MQTVRIGVPLLAALVFHFVWAGERPPRIWILPFDNPKAEVSLKYLEEALPALLSVAISQSDQHAVVDRRHLNQVLAEQSLTLEGLTAQDARQEVGKLLGATVVITGSFVMQGQDLLIAVQASDVETARITAAAEARGPAGQPGRLVNELYRRLSRDLGRRLPDPGPDQIDDAPAANLHFMLGLGYYFSARYNQALAEFLQVAREERLTDNARLWLAKSYLASEQYGHAYLELSRLTIGGSRGVRQAEIDAGIRACERHLSAEELEIIRELASVKSPSAE